ncbi:hypothetical protein DEAC_c14490 [Desulfosporosinus acididurans]|uniref:Uncharacterized protein n=1 Tax=Desulfosporosinus acididurans TaxID=476652 RepID=A0A0J1IQ13_9FIRM|nr:hypothetical protein [Desulfosporosinus acididurans]KLU66781.1 hypothetical protein DEAC_c14490 [Desulfosporosinus acididurans]
MNLLKLEGFTPTPELEDAVKGAIEAGKFAVNNAYWNTTPKQEEQVAAVASAVPPDQAVQVAVTNAVTQAVIPIAQQAASDAVNQAITQVAQAAQGALSPQPVQPAQMDQQAQAPTQ